MSTTISDVVEKDVPLPDEVTNDPLRAVEILTTDSEALETLYQGIFDAPPLNLYRYAEAGLEEDFAFRYTRIDQWGNMDSAGMTLWARLINSRYYLAGSSFNVQ